MGRQKPAESIRLSESELSGQLLGSESPLFLRRYDRGEIEAWFEQGGLTARLRELGYIDTFLELSSEGAVHVARMFDRRFSESLIDLRVSEPLRPVPERLQPRLGHEPIRVLLIEWVSFSHITGQFAPGRRPFPGQKYPGLGLGRRIYRMLWKKARELKMEALSAYPLYFHNAVYYSRGFSYLDPRNQGELLALVKMQRSSGLSIGEVSTAIQDGRLRRAGISADWKAGEMYAALSRRLSRYFASEFYADQVASSEGGAEYGLADS